LRAPWPRRGSSRPSNAICAIRRSSPRRSRRYATALAERAKLLQSDHGAATRIAALEREISNLADAIASGFLRSSPALAQRLAAAEAEFERLRLERQPKARVIARIAPKVGERFLVMVDELEACLGHDPERSRPALIEAIGDRIVLKPDASGRFMWAEHGLQEEGLMAALGMQCQKWQRGRASD
jgi:hypothetical protein